MTNEQLEQMVPNARKIQKEIKGIIEKEYPLWYMSRTIKFEKSHTVHACGDTRLWKKYPTAVVRLSTRYDQSDGNTFVHELVHAYLPFGEGHGEKFQTVCKYISFYTEYDPLAFQEICEPKYKIKYYRKSSKTLVRIEELYRATKRVKYLKAMGGKVDFIWEQKEYTAVLEVGY